MWGNVAEAPGKPFSKSSARLANVLYIHYLSKVPTHLHGQPAQACIPHYLGPLTTAILSLLTPEADLQEVLALYNCDDRGCLTFVRYWQAYEFTDTLIMVLKKNERQISFLHIYHHATTFFPCWCV